MSSFPGRGYPACSEELLLDRTVGQNLVKPRRCQRVLGFEADGDVCVRCLEEQRSIAGMETDKPPRHGATMRYHHCRPPICYGCARWPLWAWLLVRPMTEEERAQRRDGPVLWIAD